MTDQNTPTNHVRLTWNHGPIITIVDQETHTLSARLTPAQTAALIKRLATYLATWHRNDINLANADHETDPSWQPPNITHSDQDTP